MKKLHYLFLLILVFTGCSADFQAELVGGYRVERSSPNRIKIEHKDKFSQKQRVIIPAKVVEVAWNDKFILAKQQHLESDEYTPIDGKFSYWILKVNNDQLSGPFDYKQYREKIVNLGIPENINFVETLKRNFPNASMFN